MVSKQRNAYSGRGERRRYGSDCGMVAGQCDACSGRREPHGDGRGWCMVIVERYAIKRAQCGGDGGIVGMVVDQRDTSARRGIAHVDGGNSGMVASQCHANSRRNDHCGDRGGSGMDAGHTCRDVGRVDSGSNGSGGGVGREHADHRLRCGEHRSDRGNVGMVYWNGDNCGDGAAMAASVPCRASQIFARGWFAAVRRLLRIGDNTMAGNFCRVQYDGEIATAAAGTPKTVLMIQAAANIGLRILDWSIAFEGVDAAAEPVLVELRKFTTATAGTSGGAANVTKLNGRAETPQFTATRGYTAEPTVASDVIDRQKVHPQTGVEFRWPCEVLLAGGEKLAIRVTVPTGGAVIDCTPRMTVEE